MATPPQPPQQSPQQQQSDSHLIAAVAGVLLIGASLSLTASGIASLTGIGVSAVTAALESCGFPVPLSKPSSAKTAYAAAKDANRLFRAAFVVAASRRIATGLKSGRPIDNLMGHERTLWQLHRSATARRLASAATVDVVAGRSGVATPRGTLVGWYATVDGRTDPTCIAANGTNFYAEVPPMVGYPGAVHLHCRCEPGRPHVGAKMTYGVSMVRRGPDSSSFYTGSLRP